MFSSAMGGGELPVAQQAAVGVDDGDVGVGIDTPGAAATPVDGSTVTVMTAVPWVLDGGQRRSGEQTGH